MARNSVASAASAVMVFLSIVCRAQSSGELWSALRSSGAGQSRSMRGRIRRGARTFMMSLVLALLVLPRTVEAKGGSKAARGSSSAAGAKGSSSSGASGVNGGSMTLTQTQLDIVNATNIHATAVLNDVKNVLCVDYNILQRGNFTSELSDGFFGLGPADASGPVASAILAAMNTPGTRVPLDSTALEGANYFLLDFIATAGSFNISFEAYILPPAVRQAGLTDPTAIERYLFGLTDPATGQAIYDCIASATMMFPSKALYGNFLAAHQPFSYQLTAEVAMPQPMSLANKFTTWAAPFDREVWMYICFLLLGSAAIMYCFEFDADNIADFGPEYLHPLRRLGRGFFRSMCTYTMVGTYEPNTPAGRIYSICFAFVILLVQSAYTANLAGYFTKGTVATQKVPSIAAVQQQGLTCCIENDPLMLNWASSYHPGVNLAPINTMSALGLLQVMKAGGVCDAILAPTPEVYNALNYMDANNNSYCEYELVGSDLQQGFYSILFNKNSTQINTFPKHAALNSIVTEALTFGYYGAGVNSFFSGSRTDACLLKQYLIQTGGVVMDAMAPLTVNQMAGVFFVQASGLGISFMIHMIVSKRGLKGLYTRYMDKDDPCRRPAVEGEGGEEGGEGDGDEAPAVKLTADGRPVKEIPLNAMMNIDQLLDRAGRALHIIQQQQASLQASCMTAAPEELPGRHETTQNVPLHVLAKMDRAVGFGLRARAALTLLDAQNTQLARSVYTLDESALLGQAFMKMTERDALEFDGQVTAFLRSKTEEMRKARLQRKSRKMRTQGNEEETSGGGGLRNILNRASGALRR